MAPSGAAGKGGGTFSVGLAPPALPPAISPSPTNGQKEPALPGYVPFNLSGSVMGPGKLRTSELAVGANRFREGQRRIYVNPEVFEMLNKAAQELDEFQSMVEEHVEQSGRGPPRGYDALTNTVAPEGAQKKKAGRAKWGAFNMLTNLRKRDANLPQVTTLMIPTMDDEGMDSPQGDLGAVAMGLHAPHHGVEAIQSPQRGPNRMEREDSPPQLGKGRRGGGWQNAIKSKRDAATAAAAQADARAKAAAEAGDEDAAVAAAAAAAEATAAAALLEQEEAALLAERLASETSWLPAQSAVLARLSAAGIPDLPLDLLAANCSINDYLDDQDTLSSARGRSKVKEKPLYVDEDAMTETERREYLKAKAEFEAAELSRRSGIAEELLAIVEEKQKSKGVGFNGLGEEDESGEDDEEVEEYSPLAKKTSTQQPSKVRVKAKTIAKLDTKSDPKPQLTSMTSMSRRRAMLNLASSDEDEEDAASSSNGTPEPDIEGPPGKALITKKKKAPQVKKSQSIKSRPSQSGHLASSRRQSTVGDRSNAPSPGPDEAELADEAPSRMASMKPIVPPLNWRASFKLDFSKADEVLARSKRTPREPGKDAEGNIVEDQEGDDETIALLSAREIQSGRALRRTLSAEADQADQDRRPKWVEEVAEVDRLSNSSEESPPGLDQALRDAHQAKAGSRLSSPGARLGSTSLRNISSSSMIARRKSEGNMLITTPDQSSRRLLSLSEFKMRWKPAGGKSFLRTDDVYKWLPPTSATPEKTPPLERDRLSSPGGFTGRGWRAGGNMDMFGKIEYMSPGVPEQRRPRSAGFLGRAMAQAQWRPGGHTSSMSGLYDYLKTGPAISPRPASLPGGPVRRNINSPQWRPGGGIGSNFGPRFPSPLRGTLDPGPSSPKRPLKTEPFVPTEPWRNPGMELNRPPERTLASGAPYSPAPENPFQRPDAIRPPPEPSRYVGPVKIELPRHAVARLQQQARIRTGTVALVEADTYEEIEPVVLVDGRRGHDQSVHAAVVTYRNKVDKFVVGRAMRLLWEPLTYNQPRPTTSHFVEIPIPEVGVSEQPPVSHHTTTWVKTSAIDPLSARTSLPSVSLHASESAYGVRAEGSFTSLGNVNYTMTQEPSSHIGQPRSHEVRMATKPRLMVVPRADHPALINAVRRKSKRHATTASAHDFHAHPVPSRSSSTTYQNSTAPPPVSSKSWHDAPPPIHDGHVILPTTGHRGPSIISPRRNCHVNMFGAYAPLAEEYSEELMGPRMADPTAIEGENMGGQGRDGIEETFARLGYALAVAVDANDPEPSTAATPWFGKPEAEFPHAATAVQNVLVPQDQLDQTPDSDGHQQGFVAEEGRLPSDETIHPLPSLHGQVVRVVYGDHQLPPGFGPESQGFPEHTSAEAAGGSQHEVADTGGIAARVLPTPLNKAAGVFASAAGRQLLPSLVPGVQYNSLSYASQGASHHKWMRVVDPMGVQGKTTLANNLTDVPPVTVTTTNRKSQAKATSKVLAPLAGVTKPFKTLASTLTGLGPGLQRALEQQLKRGGTGVEPGPSKIPGEKSGMTQEYSVASMGSAYDSSSYIPSHLPGEISNNSIGTSATAQGKPLPLGATRAPQLMPLHLLPVPFTSPRARERTAQHMMAMSLLPRVLEITQSAELLSKFPRPWDYTYPPHSLLGDCNSDCDSRSDPHLMAESSEARMLSFLTEQLGSPINPTTKATSKLLQPLQKAKFAYLQLDTNLTPLSDTSKIDITTSSTAPQPSPRALPTQLSPSIFATQPSCFAAPQLSVQPPQAALSGRAGDLLPASTMAALTSEPGGDVGIAQLRLTFSHVTCSNNQPLAPAAQFDTSTMSIPTAATSTQGLSSRASRLLSSKPSASADSVSTNDQPLLTRASRLFPPCPPVLVPGGPLSQPGVSDAFPQADRQLVAAHSKLQQAQQDLKGRPSRALNSHVSVKWEARSPGSEVSSPANSPSPQLGGMPQMAAGALIPATISNHPLSIAWIPVRQRPRAELTAGLKSVIDV